MGQYTPASSGEAPTLVVVGHASRDIVDDDRRGWRLGGSVAYVSLTAARLGIPSAALVGLDEEAAAASELELLRAAGVALRPVPTRRGPVFRNVETASGRRQECLSAGPPLDPGEIPATWREAPAWAFVPVLGELRGPRWASVAGPEAFVAVGWQGLLRRARPGGATRSRRPARDALLERADLTVASDDDLAASGPGWGPSTAHRRIAPLFRRDGQHVALTDAQRGGRLLIRIHRGWDIVRYRAAPGRSVDPTGSGDVFLAAYLATVLDPTLVTADPLVSAGPEVHAVRLRFAALAAAMAAEGVGLTAIPTRSAVLARMPKAGGLGPDASGAGAVEPSA